MKNLLNLAERFASVNWAMADQALLSGVNFLTFVLVGKAVGLTNLGVFSLAWFVVLLVYSFQFALISAPMLSLGPQQRTIDEPGYYGAVWLQSLTFAAVSFVTVLAGATIFFTLYPDSGPMSLALPIAAATVAHQLRDFVRRYFFTRGRASAAFLFDFVLFGTQISLIFLYFYFQRLTVEIALWSITSISLLMVAASVFFLGPIATVSGTFAPVLSRHWRFSRWLGASAFLDMLSAQFALIASGAILGAAAVGALKAAQTLMGLAQLMFFASQNVVPRRGGQHIKQGGAPALRRYIFRVLAVMVGLTVCFAAFFSMASEFWITFVFKEEFREYHHLIWLFGLLFIVRAIGFSSTSGLWSMEKTQPIFKAYIVGTVVAVSLTFPMLETFGVTGAAITALVVEVTLVTIVSVYFWRLSRTLSPDSDKDAGVRNRVGG